MTTNNKIRLYTIYLIRDKSNNKVYVGQTQQNVQKRFMQHMRRKENIYSSEFYDSIQQHGIENFELEILFQNTITFTQAKELEVEYIAKFDSANPQIGYNLTIGGDYNIPPILTPEQIKSAADKKRNRPIYTRRENTLARDADIFELFKQGLCTRQIQEKLNLSRCQVRKALMRYKHYVNPELNLSVGRQKNTLIVHRKKFVERHKQIFDDIEYGIKLCDVAKRFNLKPSLLERYIRQYCELQKLLDKPIHPNFLQPIDFGIKAQQEQNVIVNQLIFELFDSGKKRTEIEDFLRQEGYDKRFNYSYIKAILRKRKNL